MNGINKRIKFYMDLKCLKNENNTICIFWEAEKNAFLQNETKFSCAYVLNIKQNARHQWMNVFCNGNFKRFYRKYWR